jgi:hypothetical protein
MNGAGGMTSANWLVRPGSLSHVALDLLEQRRGYCHQKLPIWGGDLQVVVMASMNRKEAQISNPFE